MIKAPWTQDIVDRLNAIQTAGFLHPYTCGECRSDLIATTDGWKCSEVGCDYTQDWAHEPPTLDRIVTHLDALKKMLQESIEDGKAMRQG